MLEIFIVVLSVSITCEVDRVSYWSQWLLLTFITVLWIVHFVESRTVSLSLLMLLPKRGSRLSRNTFVQNQTDVEVLEFALLQVANQNLLLLLLIHLTELP